MPRWRPSSRRSSARSASSRDSPPDSLFGPVEVEPDAWARVEGDAATPQSLAAAREALSGVAAWEADAIHAVLAAACGEEGVKPRVLYTPVRVALTGKTVAPGLYESLELLGRDESLARIDVGLASLSA